MNWLAFALIAAALNGGVSVVDKFVVEKRIPDPIVYSFFMGAIGLVSAMLVLLLGRLDAVPVWAAGLAVASGAVYLAYIVLYFAALGYNDASVVVALGQITPVFSALWGFLFLHEKFGALTYLGVGITVVGAVLLSLERNEGPRGASPVQLNAALRLMAFGCFFNSISNLLLKYALAEIGVWDGFFWPRLGVFAGACAMLVVPVVRRRMWQRLSGIGRDTYGLIAGNEGVALLAVYALTLAYAIGPLTLVSPINATQALFTMFFIWAVNKIRADTVPDKTDRRRLAIRLLPLAMILSGVYLLQR